MLEKNRRLKTGFYQKFSFSAINIQYLYNNSPLYFKKTSKDLTQITWKCFLLSRLPSNLALASHCLTNTASVCLKMSKTVQAKCDFLMIRSIRFLPRERLTKCPLCSRTVTSSLKDRRVLKHSVQITANKVLKCLNALIKKNINKKPTK